MKKYSINQASEILGLSRSTLRYYDKLQLVSPARGENRYRYYTEQNLMELKYVKVMSVAGFTLEEIHQVFHHKAENASEGNCREVGIKIIQDRREQILASILELQATEKALEMSVEIMKAHTSEGESEELNSLIEEIFLRCIDY